MHDETPKETVQIQNTVTRILKMCADNFYL